MEKSKCNHEYESGIVLEGELNCKHCGLLKSTIEWTEELPKDIQSDWEERIRQEIEKMFKNRFIVDTKLFKWGGKKQFIDYIIKVFDRLLSEQRKEIERENESNLSEDLNDAMEFGARESKKSFKEELLGKMPKDSCSHKYSQEDGYCHNCFERRLNEKYEDGYKQAIKEVKELINKM